MPDFLKVNEVLSNLELREDMSAAEFGSGSAVFTLAIAKILIHGRVYAMDIQEEKLSALKSRLRLERLNNVTTMLCDLAAKRGSGLQSGELDVVLIPNMLFQNENKDGIIAEGVRILKSAGQMLVVDWAKKGPFSPKSGMTSPKEIKQIAAGLGLSLKKEFAAGDYHFALLFTKQ